MEREGGKQKKRRKKRTIEKESYRNGKYVLESMSATTTVV